MPKNQYNSKIIYKFLIFVLPFVTIAVTITSAGLMWASYRQFKNTIAQDYENILKASSGEITLYMSHAMESMETLAWVLAAQKPDAYSQKMVLTAFNHVNSEFKHISLVSPQGQIKASTRWNDAPFELEDRVFRNAKAGESTFSEVRFGDSQFPYVQMAVPAPKIGDGTILWGILDLKFVWNILEGITIGRSGYVHIMDETGKFIAHRNIDHVLTESSRLADGMLYRIRTTIHPVAWLEKQKNQTFYCLGSYVPELDWIITLRQPTKEIYYHLYQNLYWAVLITFLACLAAIVFGWYRIKVVLQPIKSIHQQVKQIIGGDLDKTVTIASHDEIGELAAAFNEMTLTLQEKIVKEIEDARKLAHAQDLAMLGTSAGKVTHEVGNLLNNVGMSAAALKYEPLSSTGKEALVQMEKESARVKAFIQNFLQFAKPIEPRLKPVALGLIADEAVNVYQSHAQYQGITFSLNWPESIPQVPADAELIYQVFNNLIKNSIEAMGSSGTLQISANVNETHLIVSVIDNGPGISPEHLDRIFEPFFTTKGKKGGGLGMAIVKSIITAHRGTITCRSAPGQATRFDIRLPLR